MSRMFFTFAGLLTATLLTCLPAFAQLDAKDFLPDAQGGSTTVAAPKEIKIDRENNVVQGATMQDALVKAAELTTEEAGGKYDVDDPPFKLIFSKQGGAGAVATGVGHYRISKNVDDTRLAMRHAYIEAFMEAKKNLATGFAHMSIDARTTLKSALTTLVDEEESLKNSERSTEETVTEYMEQMIRGYVVKSVQDVPGESAIYVTVCVNARSMGKFSRPVPAVIEADELKAGLQQVFNEIQAGITVPAGGRVIVTDTGEACFVGYGSALIMDDSSPEMRTELIKNARLIASARARDSLLGMIVGDTMIWENKLQEKHIKNLKDFEDVSGDDATADTSADGIKKLEERKREILTRTARSDTTQSIRKGVLPPGIQMQTFRDKDGVWYYAVAVYSPSLTQVVSDLADEMGRATLVQPIRRGDTNNAQQELNSAVPSPEKTIKMIPTGSFGGEEE